MVFAFMNAGAAADRDREVGERIAGSAPGQRRARTRTLSAFHARDPTSRMAVRPRPRSSSTTLTGSPIMLADQAEAAYLLASDRLAKTTGQILVVDGGLHETFLR
ncbi:MAG: hypothetical protein ABR510_12235 [Trueperaceae bacterium]